MNCVRVVMIKITMSNFKSVCYKITQGYLLPDEKTL
nr:MAG TPA: hypothetical protein [Caudoviricetes sp.]